MFRSISVFSNKSLHKVIEQVRMTMEVYAYSAHLKLNIVAFWLSSNPNSYVGYLVNIFSARSFQLSPNRLLHHSPASEAINGSVIVILIILSHFLFEVTFLRSRLPTSIQGSMFGRILTTLQCRMYLFRSRFVFHHAVR